MGCVCNFLGEFILSNIGLGKMKSRHKLILAVFWFGAVSSAAISLRGALLPELKTVFSVSEGYLGFIVLAGNIGFLTVVLATGMNITRINRKKFIALGALLTGIFCILAGSAPYFIFFLLFLFLSGASTGMFRGVGITIIRDLFPGRRGRIFNLNSTMWSVGSLSGPLLVNAVLIWFGDWRWAYFLIGLAFLPVAFLALSCDFPMNISEKPLHLKDLKRMVQTGPILAMFLCLLLLGALEIGLMTWLPYYLSTLAAFSLPTANLVLSAFLAVYFPARILYSKLVERVKYTTLLFWNSITTGLALFVALTLATGYFQVVAFLAVAFLAASHFPTLMAMGVDYLPEYTGPINGLAITGYITGGLIFSVLIGFLVEKFGVAWGMQALIILPFVTALVIFGVRKGNYGV